MFKHIPITDQKLWENTLSQWKEETLSFGDDGVFLASDIEQRLNGLKQQTEREKHFYCYFLVRDGAEFASSLLEISHAMPKSKSAWLKLLSITIRPSLIYAADGDAANFKEAFTVLAFSITHAMELMFREHKSKELKIYGRTPEMVYFFKAIVSTGQLDTVLDTLGVDARLEGRWLVLSRDEKR